MFHHLTCPFPSGTINKCPPTVSPLRWPGAPYICSWFQLTDQPPGPMLSWQCALGSWLNGSTHRQGQAWWHLALLSHHFASFEAAEVNNCQVLRWPNQADPLPALFPGAGGCQVDSPFKDQLVSDFTTGCALLEGLTLMGLRSRSQGLALSAQPPALQSLPPHSRLPGDSGGCPRTSAQRERLWL